MVTNLGDFDSIFEKPGSDVSLKRKAEGQGQREYLRVYETMPAQLLNAYGMAGFAKMDKEKVWEEINKPLKTGAKYMTELCSAEEERRGVGINRFLQVLVEYLKYQKTEGMRKQNEFILKEEIYTQLYKEIDLIFQAAEYCLAGKKQFNKKGAAGLRSAVSFDTPTATRSVEQLKAYTQILYTWITSSKSRLRMLMGWQSAGGLPYVSWTHLYGVQCFVSCGNMYHGEVGKSVSLEVFQNAVVKRHEMELQGHSYLKAEDHAEDFQ
jgi:hypothetical protein